MYNPTTPFKATNNINSLPFQELASPPADEATIAVWASAHGILKKTWVYPQLLAHVAKWTLSRNNTGKYSPKQLISDACREDGFNRGVYLFLKSDSRFVTTQNKTPEFSALVPLILSAFKKLHGIKYEEWDKSEMNFGMNRTLREALMEDTSDISEDDILEARKVGLVVKTGKTAGTAKSPKTTYGIRGVDAPMSELSQLSRMILCQTWCAHPALRNDYTILDHNNWDNKPEPLLSEEVIKDGAPRTPRFTVAPTTSDMPW